MKVRKVMTYEVWTLDDRSMSFEEVERIIEEEQERIEKLWSCIDSFSSEDEAYESAESLDETVFPLIYDGNEFYF